MPYPTTRQKYARRPNQFAGRGQNYPQAQESFAAAKPVNLPRAVAIVPAPAAAAPKPELKVTGDTELWRTLQRVTSEAHKYTWATRAMAVPGGVILNTASCKNGQIAESNVFIPGARLVRTEKHWGLA